MKAVVYQEPYKVTVEEMPDPRVEAPNDAIVSYNRYLRDLIVAGRAIPSQIVSHEIPLSEAPDAYDKFDKRIDGYTKVVIKPGMAA